MVSITKVRFVDDHNIMKPFEMLQKPGQTERDFHRETWGKYCELCNKYETPGNGNHVYMNKENYWFTWYYQGLSICEVCKNGEFVENCFTFEHIAKVSGMTIPELKERGV